MDWTEAEPKFTELMNRVGTLTESLEKLETQSKGREDLIQRHKTEIGEARAEIKEALKAVQESGLSQEEKNELQKILDRAQKTEDNGSRNQGDPTNSQGKTGAEGDPRQSLNEAQRKEVDEKFKSLPPEQRAEIAGSKDELAKFIGAYLEANPTVPESLFDDSPSGGKASESNKYREMFGLSQKEKQFVPSRRQGMPSGFADASSSKDTEMSQSRRLPTGSIPRPKGMQ